jgi:hypothetical protein
VNYIYFFALLLPLPRPLPLPSPVPRFDSFSASNAFILALSCGQPLVASLLLALLTVGAYEDHLLSLPPPLLLHQGDLNRTDEPW